MKIENTKKSLYVYKRTWWLFLNPKSEYKLWPLGRQEMHRS